MDCSVKDTDIPYATRVCPVLLKRLWLLHYLVVQWVAKVITCRKPSLSLILSLLCMVVWEVPNNHFLSAFFAPLLVFYISNISLSFSRWRSCFSVSQCITRRALASPSILITNECSVVGSLRVKSTWEYFSDGPIATEEGMKCAVIPSAQDTAVPATREVSCLVCPLQSCIASPLSTCQ